MQFLLLFSSIITIIFTALVSVPSSPYLIGGMTQAQISDMFATSITPAGFTFSIWSVIYFSWILAGIVSSRIFLISITKKYFPKIIPYFIDLSTSFHTMGVFSLSIILTFLWLIPWGYLWIGTSLILMIIILILLSYIFTLTRLSSFLIRFSVDITLSWIIMATALNITVWIRYINLPFGGVGDYFYAIFALSILFIVVSFLQNRYTFYTVSFVFLWTLLGIFVAHPFIEERIAIGILAILTCVNIGKSYFSPIYTISR